MLITDAGGSTAGFATQSSAFSSKLGDNVGEKVVADATEENRENISDEGAASVAAASSVAGSDKFDGWAVVRKTDVRTNRSVG